MIDLEYMLDGLMHGQDLVDNNIVNEFACDILQGKYDMSDKAVLSNLKTLITICNILYNNTDRSILPIEDGIYDMLVVLANKYIGDISVGAPPTDIKVEQIQLPKPFIKIEALQQGFIKLDKDKLDKCLFREDLTKAPIYIEQQFYRRGLIDIRPITKKTLNIPHEYPKLVGTLDKCKFTLNWQAEERGVLNDPNVGVFERDFLGKHVNMGIVDPNHIKILVSLKMDGVSVEGTVTDHLISARSRGDTNNDIASDLTPALKGYKFPKAKGYVKEPFGMKFECMLSNQALYELGELRNVKYKNPRNAIIGLLGAGDCNQWLEYITLIPLETSLDIDPVDEMVFMNELYAMEPLRFVVIEGTYDHVLFELSKFVEEAEFLRPVMPYIYDGVVVSYVDKDIRKALGRDNSVNKYSVAIKFNPEKKYTTFIGYTFSVGQNGVVTPVAHYQPVELFGAIHTKTTTHSLKRFSELSLREGDIVTIELVNDVIPYISKADVAQNQNNPNPIIPFPEACPCCGSKLIISKSGKTAVCPNKDCPERHLSIIVNMLDKIGFKDFSEETLKLINNVHSLTDLINIKEEDLYMLGPVERVNFMDRVKALMNSNLFDYQLVGALGFTNIGQERWSIILRNIRLEDIINLDDTSLREKLHQIKSIGPVIVETIISERDIMMNDLITICNVIPHKVSFGVFASKQIRFTGCRDYELIERLSAEGYDINDKNITKNTDILLVPYLPYESSKTKKVSPDCIIVAIDDFKQNMDEYLSV